MLVACGELWGKGDNNKKSILNSICLKDVLILGQNFTLFIQHFHDKNLYLSYFIDDLTQNAENKVN